MSVIPGATPPFFGTCLGEMADMQTEGMVGLGFGIVILVPVLIGLTYCIGFLGLCFCDGEYLNVSVFTAKSCTAMEFGSSHWRTDCSGYDRGGGAILSSVNGGARLSLLHYHVFRPSRDLAANGSPDIRAQREGAPGRPASGSAPRIPWCTCPQRWLQRSCSSASASSP